MTTTVENNTKQNIYFGQDTEDAIYKLVTENLTDEEFEKTYLKHVHDSFISLAENILYTYGKQHNILSMGLTPKELITSGVSFMYKRIKRFNPNKDSAVESRSKVKAFSFFGTIVKRYYIQLSISHQREEKRNVCINDDDTFILQSAYENLHVNEQKENEHKEEMSLFTKEMISWFERHKDYVFENEQEWKIGQAILTLFANAENLETSNKKKLYIFLREITGEEQRKLTPVIKKMSVEYSHLRKNYNRSGKVFSGSLK